MKNSVFLVLCVTYFTLKITSGSECGLDLQDADKNFMFVEVREDITVGTRLAKYTTLSATSISNKKFSTSNKYIEIRFNEANQEIEFFLTSPLIEYRQDKWDPSLEIEFNISCASMASMLRSYTFLLMIEDENIYPPELTSSEKEFNVSLPWPKNVKINSDPIRIQDIDYNYKHSTCEITCESKDCKYFFFEKVPTEDKLLLGHNYDVYIYYNDSLDYTDIATGHTFSLNLVANDSAHRSEVKLSIRVSQVASNSKFPLAAVAGGGSALGVVGLLFAIALSYSTIKNRKARSILRKLTEAEIREFLDGTTGFGGSVPKRSIDVNSPILAMPYNQTFTIPRDKLKIDETTVLGTGFFGIVMKGTVTLQNDESFTVAVKAVKRNVGVLYFKALLSELKIMAFIGKHQNIVSLIGACTHNIRKREVYIAVEYCANGNLHNFLQVNRTNFLNLVRDGKLCGLTASNNYAYRRRSSTANKVVSTLNLIKWSIQISNGMEYLSSLGVIHGDLATRNILLDSKFNCKVADFGLSRRLIDYSSDYYTKNSQGPLPWKWMAPESLKDMKFSKKSDVWSYGIVLYEIFALGQTPYPGLSWDETFVDRLEKGLRMGQPQFASDEIYEIMSDCWTEDPHDRPAIFDIKRNLEGMASSLLLQTADEGYFRVAGGAEKCMHIGRQLSNEDFVDQTENSNVVDC